MKNPISLILVFFIVILATTVPTADLVKPMLEVPYSADHAWYSGYLNVTNGKFHYVFFDSQRDPKNDPVLLWLNGGPGCSSMIGMTYQNGPFVFKINSTDFQPNLYSWNLKANVLYIQSPGGVGYSTTTKTQYTDQSTAIQNLQALLHFFKLFPTLKNNQFYISGQSYGGIYVPYLAYQILKHNKLPLSKQTKINLKGIMVGNGCTDPSQCYFPGPDGTSMHQYQFFYKHGYIDQSTYNRIVAVCTLGYHGGPCKKIRQQTDKDFGKTRTNILNIYDLCYANFSRSTSETSKRILKQSGRFHPLVGDDTLNCNDAKGIYHFFNSGGMFQKLHVDPIHFQQCSDMVADKYQISQNASYWIYPILMRQKLRIFIYSGDADADVPITGTLRWIEKFKQEYGLTIREPWRQWWVKGIHEHEDQVAGMVWHLQGFTFVSIKGAGHMAPKDKRKQSYQMLNSFLNDKPLPQKS